MPSFEDILRVHHLQRVELQAWIEHRWVRPQAGAEGLVFDEVDEARITLIRDLRQELLVDDEALEVVLSLLDQLYAVRRMLKCLEQAIETLPAPIRDELRARLRDRDPS